MKRKKLGNGEEGTVDVLCHLSSEEVKGWQEGLENKST